jgi:adenylate kinase family enzyme
MLESTAPMEIGKGAVIFLIGTSTAGKTTLCKTLQEQDLDLPPEKRLGWQVWGDDLEREWLKEDANSFFKKTADTGRDWNERTFDRAIAASLAGKSMILDTFLDHVDGKVIWDHFKEYSESKGITCPTQVVFLHLPIPELTARITERNRQATERRDTADRRVGIGPFEAYAELFGANYGTGLGVTLEEVLRREDVIRAVHEFACDKDDKRFLDMEDSTKGAMLIKEQSNDLLKKLGFEGEEESIPLGTKGWRPDFIYDNSKMPTAEIADGIRELAIKEILKQGHAIAESPTASPRSLTATLETDGGIAEESQPLIASRLDGVGITNSGDTHGL